MKKSRYKEINVKRYDERYLIEFKEKSFSDLKWLTKEELEKLVNDISIILKG